MKYNISQFFKKNFWYILLVISIIILAFLIRWHNIHFYTTWWADDGGGHIKYIETIINYHRLPTTQETYLAWHEPLYYIFLFFWIKFWQLFNLTSQYWWVGLNILISFFFGLIVWLLSYYFGQKNKWLALLNFFIFSVLFVGIKLSAYINNEYLTQTLILLVIFLFYQFKLLEIKKIRLVIIWSVILALALLVKLTAFIILLSALLIWSFYWIITKKKFYLKYILLCLSIIFFINLPWLIYKYQNFGQLFSINLYETNSKQNVFTSVAWKYLAAINYHFVADYPFWFSKPNSYYAILISDTFGDYYNLFNNVDRINNLPEGEKILVGNGRFTTPRLWQSLLWANRIGLVIFLIWLIGFVGYLISQIKLKKIDKYELFLLLALFGGWFALIYNNLRFPYLERGVLKAHFIYYTYPIFTLLAYRWWRQKIKNKWLFAAIAFLPIIIYLIIAWPMLYIK